MRFCYLICGLVVVETSPAGLLKGYMFLGVLNETICVRRTKTFTQDETTRTVPRKGWRAEGLSAGQRQTLTGAAAHIIERHRAAAAITIRHAGVHRGHTCPLCALLGPFPAREKDPGAWGRRPHKAMCGNAVPARHVAFPPTPRSANLSASVPCAGTDASKKRALRRSLGVTLDFVPIYRRKGYENPSPAWSGHSPPPLG